MLVLVVLACLALGLYFAANKTLPETSQQTVIYEVFLRSYGTSSQGV
jgi:hypothetical protein